VVLSLQRVGQLAQHVGFVVFNQMVNLVLGKCAWLCVDEIFVQSALDICSDIVKIAHHGVLTAINGRSEHRPISTANEKRIIFQNF